MAYGGAPAASDLVRRIKAVFPQASPGVGWGMTETTSTFTSQFAEEYINRPDSSGPAWPVCDMKIVGDDGETLPVGDVGELIVAGPNIVSEYWNKPEATAEAIQNGWLKTGDLARMDDGRLRLHRRSQEGHADPRRREHLLRRGRERAVPAPGVVDAAVIGLPHQTLGEEPAAVVTLGPGSTVTEAELKAFASQHIAAFKVPIRIVFSPHDAAAQCERKNSQARTEGIVCVIEISEQDGIRTLRLAHRKASALDSELVIALEAALAQAARDKVGAAVLTGTGSIFCAGVDLFRVANGGRAYTDDFLPAFEKLMFTLFEFERPLVVAANGHAIAGGAVLLAAGDARLMTAGSSRFGYTELLVGVPFPPAALEIIRFGTPERHQQKLLFTGQTCSVEDAVRRGFAEEAVAPADLMARALVVAKQYASLPGDGFRVTKQQLRAPVVRRMRESEVVFGPVVAQAWRDPETQARIHAYLARTVRQG